MDIRKKGNLYQTLTSFLFVDHLKQFHKDNDSEQKKMYLPVREVLLFHHFSFLK